MYTFKVRVEDNNICGASYSDYIFKVVVICQGCPLDVYYQDRHPNNKRLPTETHAGRDIIAGKNVDSNQPIGTVETGTDNVLFVAGHQIVLDPGFIAGPNFVAKINPTTCTKDCNTCCDDFLGFSYEPIPNVFTPNGDGINDIWEVTDYQHPYCAYNAKGYHLQIYNRWGTLIYNKAISSSFCCPFTSPPYTGSNEIASISWNGRVNGTGYIVSSGTYDYILTLTACNHTATYTGSMTIFSSARLANKKDATHIDTTTVNKSNNSINVKIRPNPAKNILYITIIDDENDDKIYYMTIINSRGKTVKKEEFSSKTTNQVNINGFAKGLYTLRLLSNNGKAYINRQFVKE